MKVTTKLLEELIRLCEESDAGFGKLVLEDDAGRAIGVVIVADGDRTADVLEVIEEVESRWELEE